MLLLILMNYRFFNVTVLFKYIMQHAVTLVTALLILYDFWIFLSLFVRRVDHGRLRVQTCR